MTVSKSRAEVQILEDTYCEVWRKYDAGDATEVDCNVALDAFLEARAAFEADGTSFLPDYIIPPVWPWRRDVTTTEGHKLERWWCNCHKQRSFTSKEAADNWHERQLAEQQLQPPVDPNPGLTEILASGLVTEGRTRILFPNAPK